MIIHKEFAQNQGRLVCEKIKRFIPRHNFMKPIQDKFGKNYCERKFRKGFKKTF